MTTILLSQPPLHAMVLTSTQTQPRFAHSTSPIASGLGCHTLTLENVFSLARNASCDHGEKFGGFWAFASILLVGVEAGMRAVGSEPLDVLCRNRFRARSRASSKAAAAVAGLLDAVVSVDDGTSETCELDVKVSTAL